MEPGAVESRRGAAQGRSTNPAPVGRFGSLAGRTERWLLERLLASTGRPRVRIALWNGVSAGPADAPPVATIVVRDRATLARLVAFPDLAFGEAYAEGRIEVEGDLVELLTEAARVWLAAPGGGLAQLVARTLARPHANTPAQSRENIRRHYDLGNDFYALWLDPRLVYTCAYFPTPGATLEAAQEAKLEHVARKLALAPGESVVEAGAGWGALALHLAARHGVRVTAYNISHEQVVYARQQARELGLADRVEFVEDDWRAIRGRFDAFVSVGMLEHVGRGHYGELAAVMERSVARTGRGLLHFIGRSRREPMNAWLERHIFPGSYAPTLREALETIEPGFAVVDVENLRRHYELTLAHWLERFEAARARVEQMFDARLVRAWRLYLAGSIASFRTGALELFQVAFARVGKNDLPWTRAHLYEKRGRGAARRMQGGGREPKPKPVSS
jgi:cyclopropane-fatty-acyl-phospholipid synthase